MMQNNDRMETEYRDHIDTVRVGDKYAEAELANGDVIRRGDIVVYEDRDIDHRDRDRGVTQRLFVGFVEAIGDMNHTEEPELFITAGIGRLGVHDNTVHVSGEGVRPDPQSGVQKFIEQFLNETGLSGDDEYTDTDVRELRVEIINGKTEKRFHRA